MTLAKQKIISRALDIVFLLGLLLFARTVSGASWYVDNAATAGSNNGTSWANAWTNNASIVWSGAGVNPGDTLFVSGGTTSKVYNEGIYIGIDGTAGNPISLRIGQDTGHNGVADFGTNTFGPLSTKPNYNIINGHRGLSYPDPTNWAQVASGEWTNNIGFWSHDRRQDTLSSSPFPAFFYVTGGADDVLVRYVRVSGYTNTFTGGGSGYDERGVLFTVKAEGTAPTNMIFEHLWLYGNSGGQFQSDTSTNNAYDQMRVRFSLVEWGGEDHFKVGRGWSIHDNVIGPVLPDDEHCDYFQNTFGWFRVYNNYVKEGQHSLMRLQMNAGKNPSSPTTNGHIQVFNNVISAIPGRSPYGDFWNEQVVFVNEDSSIEKGGYGVWEDIWFVNNTWYGNETNTWRVPPVIPANPVISWSKGQYVTNAWLNNINFLNNIFDLRWKGITFPATTNTGGVNAYGNWINYEPFTTNELRVNYNIVSGTNFDTSDGHFIFSLLNVASNMYQHPYQFLNKTNRPAFINATNGNFELSSSDTAAANSGTNITWMFSFDTLNRSRFVGSGVDIGAFERQDTSLLVYLSFDNDASTTNATDDSGNGYTGYRYNLSEYSYPSNKAYNASGAPGLVFRPNFTGRYADFLWRTNNGTYNPTYLTDGSFYGITNASSVLTNMSEATIMIWARYNSNSRTDRNAPSYQYEQSATLLSGGTTATATPGSWLLGRYIQDSNLNETRFQIQTNNSATGSFGSAGDPVFGDAGKLIFNFPERGFDNNGDTTNWHHYAITFSNGTIRTYFNGAAITNHTAPTITKLTLGIPNQGGYPPWLGVGVHNHSGNPLFDDEGANDYPNNGWLNGALDQGRIYNRALTHQEIIDVANSEGAEFADAPAPLPGPIISGRISTGFNIKSSRRGR